MSKLSIQDSFPVVFNYFYFSLLHSKPCHSNKTSLHQSHVASCQGQICNPKWSQQSIWDSLCNTQIGDDESQVEMNLHGRYPINPKPCTLLTQEEEVKPAWFCEMKKYLDSMDSTLVTSSDRLYNAVETGFHLSSKPPTVKAAKGSKHVNNVPATQSRASRYLSVVLRVVTTFIFFPYNRRPAFDLMAGFLEAKFYISPNGWIKTDMFMSCLRDCYVPAVPHKRKPVVLLINSHISNTDVIHLCIKDLILLYCLKSYASYIIQPLEQSLFGTMKQAWGSSAKRS